MAEGWHLPGGTSPLAGDEAADLIRRRVRDGLLETWLEHTNGRMLAVVSNKVRAMVMLLDEPGDPGAHAIDPDAVGHQGGYVLDNGQNDAYDNRDTVALDQALHAVRHIVEHGNPPADITWQSDR